MLGTQGVAQTPAPNASPAPMPARCSYYPTPPIPPIIAVGRPRLQPAGAPFVANVLVRIPHGADIASFPGFSMSTPGEAANRMKAEGPIAPPDVRARFDSVPLPDWDYWVLSAPLASPTSFAVYYDEVWPGREFVSDLPCSASFRRVVVTVAAGPQHDAESASRGHLRLSTSQLVSTEFLSSMEVVPPTRRRSLESTAALRGVVTFRADAFQPRSESETLAVLDARRGFDSAIMAVSEGPATLQSRLVIGRSDDGRNLAYERFSWADGDAVATSTATRSCDCVRADGSWRLVVPSGASGNLALRIVPRSNGMIQIIDVTPIAASPSVPSGRVRASGIRKT